MKTNQKKKLFIRLPFNFKERIVEGELKLESESNNQKIIQDLMTLYTVISI